MWCVHMRSAISSIYVTRVGGQNPINHARSQGESPFTFIIHDDVPEFATTCDRGLFAWSLTWIGRRDVHHRFSLRIFHRNVIQMQVESLIFYSGHIAPTPRSENFVCKGDIWESEFCHAKAHACYQLQTRLMLGVCARAPSGWNNKLRAHIIYVYHSLALNSTRPAAECNA